MLVMALSTRWGAIYHNGRIWRYDGDTVAFEDGELWLIHGGLGQMIEGLDGIDRKGRGQTAVADVDPRGTVFVHPTSFPTTIFLLESEKGSKVHLVPDPNGRAG